MLKTNIYSYCIKSKLVGVFKIILDVKRKVKICYKSNKKML